MYTESRVLKPWTLIGLVGAIIGIGSCADESPSSDQNGVDSDVVVGSGDTPWGGTDDTQLAFPDGFDWSDPDVVGVMDGGDTSWVNDSGGQPDGGAVVDGENDDGGGIVPDIVETKCESPSDCPASFVSACTEPLCEQGRCVKNPVADGTTCEDGLACTIEDSCQAGECVGEAICVCKTTADCFTYEDGDLCNGTLVCVDQQCVVDATTVVLCKPSEVPCLESVCDQDDGVCVTVPVAAGTDCDDQDPCTTADSCVDDVCKGVAIECDDSNSCTVDTCTEGKCTTTPVGGACNDGDPCTTGDTCLSGTCIGQPATKCACNTDLDCLAFDDDDLCNGVLVCIGNQCSLDPASVVSCDPKPCETVTCEPSTGECVGVGAKDGTACDDGDVCTKNDQCTAGVCAGNQASSCQCVTNADCAKHEDGNLCNGTLQCQDNACVVAPETVIQCSPTGTVCQTQVCEPSTGKCSAVSVNNGAPCDDGDACTVAEVCGDGKCGPGAPKPCNDGNACTSDLCSAGQCVNLPLNGQPCEDGNVCTIGDACVNGACAAGPDDGCCGESQIVLGGKAYCTIQEAVDLAKAGDVITLGPVTYTESVVVNKAVTIQAASTPFPNVKSESTTKPVFRFTSGAVGAKLSKLNLFGGNSSVLVDAGAQVEINTCNPKSYLSSGVRVSGGKATMLNVFVSNIGQTATADGVRVELGGTATISGGTLEQNLGRGLYVTNGSATIADGTKIQSNKGMGVFVENGGSLAINGASFSSNSVAAIRANGSTVAITSATVSATTSTSPTDGAGVWLSACAAPVEITGLQITGSASDGVRLENCSATMSGNVTVSGSANRGVAVLSGSSATISWATISGSTHANLFVQGGTATISNSVLSGAKNTISGHGAQFTSCTGTCGLSATTVDGNAAAGVAVTNSTVSISSQSIIKNNLAIGVDGDTSCNLDIKDSTISNNTVIGVLTDNCKTTVTNTTITGTKVTVAGSGDGIQMTTCKAGTVIDGSYLKSNGRHGVFMQACPGVVINKTELANNVMYGCGILLTNGFQWTQNSVLSNGNYGMYAQGSTNGTISDNTVSNNGTSGLFLAESAALVKNNVVTYTSFATAAGGDGIALVGAVSGGKPVTPKSTFEGNQVKFNNRHGFYVLSAQADIVGNFAENNTNSGIYIQPAAIVTVLDNTVAANGKTGMVCGPGLTFLSCSNNLFSSNPTDMTPYCPASCKL